MERGTRLQFTKDHAPYVKGQILESIGDIKAQTTFVDETTKAAITLFDSEIADLPVKDITVNDSIILETSENATSETVDTDTKK